MHAGADDRVAADIAEGERRRGGKGQRIEPFRGRVRAGSKNGLSREVCTDRIFAKYRAGIRGVAKDGNCQREAGLNLVDRRELPVVRKRAYQAGVSVAGNAVDRAERDTMAEVAGQSFFCGEVAVVLGNRGLEHR